MIPHAIDEPATRAVLDDPLVAFAPEIRGDLEAAPRQEWLVTNGFGGNASGILAEVPTRSDHGFLVAGSNLR